MSEDLEQLKQRLPLLEYLQRHNWTANHVGAGDEFVGLCPLHPDTQPSFYINARKNLFYCHGCNCGGDLIRFVELSEHLSFRESVAHLKHEITLAAESELLDRTAAFYQLQLQAPPRSDGVFAKARPPGSGPDHRTGPRLCARWQSTPSSGRFRVFAGSAVARGVD